MRLTLGLVTAALLLLIPFRRAEACAAPLCIEPARAAPAAGESVPANAPAIALVPNFLTPPKNPDAGIAIFDSNGGALAHTVTLDSSSLIIRPEAPLIEGSSYLLRFGDTCDFSPVPSDGGTHEATIQVGPPAPLPTTVGELSVLDIKEVDFGPSFLGGCGGPDGVNMTARVGISPSPEMAPWLPVTRFVLSVDGVPWDSLPHGLIQANGDFRPPNPGGNPFVGSRFFRVHARCPFQPDSGADFSRDPGVRTGRHVAKLEAFIAGSDASIPASTVAFSLMCDGGFEPSDGPGPLEPLDDLAEGCNCGASGAGGFASLLLLLVADRVARRVLKGSAAA